MTRRPYVTLAIILLIVAFALWVDLSKQLLIYNPINNSPIINRAVPLQLGLDLRGGLQVLLEADLPNNSAVSSTDLSTTQKILQNRVNGLGVSEVVMQSAPPNRIVAEFPGLQDPQQVVAALQETGLLEFVDFGDTQLAPDTLIKTDFATEGAGPNGIVTPAPTTTAAATATATNTPVATATSASTPGATAVPAATPAPATETVYHTVMTGSSISSVNVSTGASVGSTSPFVVNFTLKSDWSTV